MKARAQMVGLLALAKSTDSSFTGTKEPFYVISKIFNAFDHSFLIPVYFSQRIIGLVLFSQTYFSYITEIRMYKS